MLNVHRLAVCATTLLIAGCGGGTQPHRAQPPARPLSAQNPISGIQRATPADFARPIRLYRRHVVRQLGALTEDVTRLRTAIAARDLPGARAAWRAANARYQTIGAAYGAFGDLDRAVDRTTAGLRRGAADRQFTGLHRVELALFGRRSLEDARAPARGLDRAVARMRARMPRLRIDPLEYSLRAHEVLEDTLHLQLTGQASPWSGAAYDAVAANVRGTRVVLATLAPLIDARSQGVRLGAERALDRVARALQRLRGRHGGYPTLHAAGQLERERIAALVAAAAERLASIPELIDPRPPRPVRGAFGETAR
jgi:iron uptake system component EfeO